MIAPATMPGVGTGDIACVVFERERLTYGAEASGSATENARSNVRFVGLVYTGFSGEIAEQLSAEPMLVEFLVSAYLPLLRSFGQAPTLRLTRFFDPDSENDAARFVVDVETRLPIDDAIEALDAFDRSWFLHNMTAVAGRITFLLSFS